MAVSPPMRIRQVSATRDTIGVAWDRDESGVTPTYEYRLNGGPPVSVGSSNWISINELVPDTKLILEVRASYPESISTEIQEFFGEPELSDWSEPVTVTSKKIDRIVWSDPGTRFFDAGLDRGVLYPKGSASPVPWDGLVAVEQTGGEEVTTYFSEGRPYLHLPRPKEYSAVIRAYTYPDAFSAIMGVPEIADGMYLDSQIGESFDLSYRTLVGNGVEGLEHGYKIHLVYNATVAPEAVTYESFSGSINPIEFAWSINAVPERVEGYRPSAHIVIDTRHMAPHKVARIEEMLYGGDLTDASMPRPSEIFDILSLSEDIVITDNGDQTWTAEGSYRNVFVTEPGYFVITNVDAVDHGDGTYTISTTRA